MLCRIRSLYFRFCAFNCETSPLHASVVELIKYLNIRVNRSFKVLSRFIEDEDEEENQGKGGSTRWRRTAKREDWRLSRLNEWCKIDIYEGLCWRRQSVFIACIAKALKEEGTWTLWPRLTLHACQNILDRWNDKGDWKRSTDCSGVSCSQWSRRHWLIEPISLIADNINWQVALETDSRARDRPAWRLSSQLLRWPLNQAKHLLNGLRGQRLIEHLQVVGYKLYNTGYWMNGWRNIQ